MSLASPFTPQSQQQPLIPPAFNPLESYTASPWLLPQPSPSSIKSKKSKHRSKRHKKDKKKKHHKQHKKQRLGAYILQFIGLICLVLAAVKAFEPLTGVGFTLVIVGYQGGLRPGDGDLGGKSMDLFEGRMTHGC